MDSLKIAGPRRYDAMIGVGGIGAGTFFALNGDHTLGREESRGGRFLDRRDYCKGHIICHYVKVLLGPDFAVMPMGQVGDDDVGKRLMSEMDEAGLDLRYVRTSPGDPTLFSLCFVYPDGSGGNMTTDDSASSRVDAAQAAAAEPEFARLAGRGVVLAVPEVPLEAREALLKLGTKHGFLRVASFTSQEMADLRRSEIMRHVDLLALNMDEAMCGSGVEPVDDYSETHVRAAVDALREVNPDIIVTITAGRHGSWGWDGAGLHRVPVFKAKVESTAGAGDAYLSGTIAGLTAGLPLEEAQQLGALTAALSVTSPHTINKDICREALREFAQQSGAQLSPQVSALL